MPLPSLKVAIANVLKDEGYVDGVAVRDLEGKAGSRAENYAGRPVIERIERVSKPGSYL